MVSIIIGECEWSYCNAYHWCCEIDAALEKGAFTVCKPHACNKEARKN